MPEIIPRAGGGGGPPGPITLGGDVTGPSNNNVAEQSSAASFPVNAAAGVGSPTGAVVIRGFADGSVHALTIATTGKDATITLSDPGGTVLLTGPTLVQVGASIAPPSGQGSLFDLGGALTTWANLYVDTLHASATDLAGTTNLSWTVNTAASGTAQTASLVLKGRVASAPQTLTLTSNGQDVAVTPSLAGGALTATAFASYALATASASFLLSDTVFTVATGATGTVHVTAGSGGATYDAVSGGAVAVAAANAPLSLAASGTGTATLTSATTTTVAATGSGAVAATGGTGGVAISAASTGPVTVTAANAAAALSSTGTGTSTVTSASGTTVSSTGAGTTTVTSATATTLSSTSTGTTTVTSAAGTTVSSTGAGTTTVTSAANTTVSSTSTGTTTVTSAAATTVSGTGTGTATLTSAATTTVSSTGTGTTAVTSAAGTTVSSTGTGTTVVTSAASTTVSSTSTGTTAVSSAVSVALNASGAAGVVTVATNGAERARVNASGALLVGTAGALAVPGIGLANGRALWGESTSAGTFRSLLFLSGTNVVTLGDAAVALTVPATATTFTNGISASTVTATTAVSGTTGSFTTSTSSPVFDGGATQASVPAVATKMSNTSGVNFPLGVVVAVNTTAGANAPFLARADASLTADAFGVTYEAINNGSTGRVVTAGVAKIYSASAGSFAGGDDVWLSAATAGDVTPTAPSTNAVPVFIGKCIGGGSDGGGVFIAVALRTIRYAPVLATGRRPPVLMPVINGEGTTLNPGEVVYISAGNTVSRSRANAIGTAKMFGLVFETILSGATGLIARDGTVAIPNARQGGAAWTDGSQVFVSSGVAGQLTEDAIASGNYQVVVGWQIAHDASFAYLDMNRGDFVRLVP